MKKSLFVALASLLTASVSAQSFFGSDDFNAPGPGFSTSLWSPFGSYTQQTNGRAQLININGAYNVDGGLIWTNNGSLDVGQHTYDWTVSVSATLDYDGFNGFPSLGLFAQPQGGRYFGIMLRGGQPNGSTQVFSSHTGTIIGAHIDGSFGTVGLATTSTADVTEVLLRLSWDSSADTLTSDYSLDGGATYATSVSLTVDGSTLGLTPNNGFSLMLYAQSGGVEHQANTMYFDNFTVASDSSAIPEPSAFSALAGAAALGLALRRRQRSTKTTQRSDQK